MKRNIFTLSLLASAAANGAIVATYQTDWATEVSTGVTSSAIAIAPNFVQENWETVAPVGSNHTFVDVVATYGDITGQRLIFRNNVGVTATTTITLNGLAAFNNISIDQLIVGAGGGIDADGNANGTELDGIQVLVDGTSILNVDLAARTDASGTYPASAPAGVILEDLATSDTDGSEFISTRTDGWGHDALYDLGADPAFDNVAVSGAGTVTIEIIAKLSDGAGAAEGNNVDEQIVVGNFDITFDDVPEPTSALLASLGVFAFLRRRRA